jgi:hypothetical protein
MMGTCGVKELKYHTMDIPTMEGLESDDCFRSENIVTDATHAVSYTCISCR